ncbi:MAG: hypothetical protein ACK2T6_04000, partial [Anaerolineae bacterium]
MNFRPTHVSLRRLSAGGVGAHASAGAPIGAARETDASMLALPAASTLRPRARLARPVALPAVPAAVPALPVALLALAALLLALSAALPAP